eukprot:CAMPEP_0172749490 /NCGR_PEP_ID=MMETSP1074-20121228/147518_1 /TAXON_ID=2916 /ORGANISM="Ceratium fusus, Strain PA161109" /LENGTH=52 /DNA_ID=CAMNT_0013581473 /DNA_START=236 /DNA_END=394 /DNA_ORIENTATION=+
MARRLVVNLLKADIRLEDIKDNLVGFPQEPEVCMCVTVLTLLPCVLCLNCTE